MTMNRRQALQTVAAGALASTMAAPAVANTHAHEWQLHVSCVYMPGREPRVLDVITIDGRVSKVAVFDRQWTHEGFRNVSHGLAVPIDDVVGMELNGRVWDTLFARAAAAEK